MNTERHGPVEGGPDAKEFPLSVAVVQDTEPKVKIYWAPSQDTMNTVPLVYTPPDEYPVKGRPIEIPRIVRLYYDGRNKQSHKPCTPESWFLVAVTGEFGADAGFPVTVFAPLGLDAIWDNDQTYNYLLGMGDIAIAHHTESDGDCQKSFCYVGDLGLEDGSEIQASTMLSLAELIATYSGSNSCLEVLPDPAPNDSHGVSTDPHLVRAGGEYAGGGKIKKLGMNFNPDGATISNGESGPDVGAPWKEAFEALKADLESTYKNLYVTVIDGKEDRFLELFTPDISEVDFVGYDVLHIAVEMSRPGVYEDLEGAYTDYAAALQTQFGFFAGLRAVVYNDIGDPGDDPDAITTFENFLNEAQGDLTNFGFEYGGEVDYHTPDTSDMRELIIQHFKLDG